MNLVKIWFSIFIVGLIFYPFTSLIFKKFNDKGWIISKIIGIAFSSLTMWLLSYTKIFKYSTLNIYLILLFFTIINLIIIYIRLNKKYKIKTISDFKNSNLKTNLLKTLKNILIIEILFIIVFSLWGFIKGFDPVIDNQTEKFMDYGYMNSIMNSNTMPPKDIWASGYSINYYYYGQYVSGFICKIANLNASEGYNCIIAFIFSCTFIIPFNIGYNLFNNKIKTKNKKIGKILPIIVALFIAIASSIGGTLHYPIYRWFAPNKADYFYSQERNYIGGKEDSLDKVATEVPSYSSIVSDLHAHYVDLLFTLTMLALLAQYFLDRDEHSFKNYKTYIYILLISVLLGIEKMTNYWDFPIYIVIIGSIIITKELICSKCNKKNIFKTLLILIGIIFIEEIITLPFTLDLKILSGTNVYFTGRCSPFYQLLIKWGLQTLCVIAFLITFFIKFKKEKNKFKEYLNKNLSDLFIIILGICAIGLVILPEIIYLKDIYRDVYKRFNTMFKLTYQAFVLFSISTSYILYSLILSKNKYIAFISVTILIVYTTSFGYGIDAIITNYKNTEYKGISAYSTEGYIRDALPNDYEAINWIKENIDRDKLIVEATKLGNSFSNYSRISTFTGNSTVLGWVYHEWLWRCTSNYSMPMYLYNRNIDIETLYNSNNLLKAQEIINKYHIDYIYIGDKEYETYQNINVDFLKSLGDIVYNKDKNYLIKVIE